MKLARIENILFFLTLLFIPIQLGKHFWLDFSFVFSLKVDYLSPVLYFWDILAISLLVVFLLQKKKLNTVALNLFLIFILSQALSINSNAFGVGLVRLEQYIVTGLFGVYIASQRFLQLKRDIFWPIAIGIIFESLLVILEFIKSSSVGFWILGERSFYIGTPAIAKFNFYGIEFLRPYATFSHPNVLAGFVVIMLPIIFLASKNRNKDFFILTVFLSFITLVLTSSRVAILGFVGVFIGLFRKPGFLILILTIVLLLPLLITRFSSLINYDTLSLGRRLQLNKIGIEAFATSPIFGIGLNNFISKEADNLIIGENRFLQPIHNIFLLTLAETGLVGFLGLTFFIVYPIWRLLKMLPSQDSLCLLISWMAILFLGNFDHYLLTSPQGVRLLMFIWGLSLSK